MNESKKRPILKDFPPEEIADLFKELGLRAYRQKQVLPWIYRKLATSFEEMTSISKEDQSILDERTYLGGLKVLERRSASDGTEKFLFELSDGERIEAVLIREQKRRTLCISTQVGCAMGCRFCLTGKQGLRRDLEPYEMVDQFLSVQRAIGKDEGIRNIVLMGMGEPLDNLDRVLIALRIFLSQEATDLSGRRITLSTCGLVPEIGKLGRSGLPIQLAVSLNAAHDRIRDQIMPINRKYPISELLQALRAFPLARRRRITFEYVLLGGVNDRPEDALRLAGILKGIRCKLNLIPFNPFSEAGYDSPKEEALLRFQKILLAHRYSTTIRKSRGGEIMAACGQLTSQQL